MKPIVTCKEMKELEALADSKGLSYKTMMEYAGKGAAEEILRTFSVPGKDILIFCGKGNNGGDGYVVARILQEAGAQVKILMVEGEPRTIDAEGNKMLCEQRGVPFLEYCDLEKETPDLIIDAIYGTGFHGILAEEVWAITRWMNRSEATIISLDIPSGLSGDTGEADLDTVKADLTLVFHSKKPAHVMEPALVYCNQIVCIDIGITALI